MTDDFAEHTKRIREAITSALVESPLEENSVPTKWIIVCERMDTNGKRWLIRFSGPDEDVPVWDLDGMLSHALSMRWPYDSEEDNEEA